MYYISTQQTDMPILSHHLLRLSSLNHYKFHSQRPINSNNTHIFDPSLCSSLKLKFVSRIEARTAMKAAIGAIVEEEFIYGEETNLTVLKTSLFFVGDGFAAYDGRGDLVFRVDSYSAEMRGEADHVLMDATGRCLLTVRRKMPSLHQRWEGFLGERSEGQKPIFVVKRTSMIGRSSESMTVEMCGCGDEYQIEGSFSDRICTVYDTSREAVAEIRRKVDASTCVMLGKEVLSLSIKPGFDAAFAMSLVLVLDQINGEDLVDHGDPAAED